LQNISPSPRKDIRFKKQRDRRKSDVYIFFSACCNQKRTLMSYFQNERQTEPFVGTEFTRKQELTAQPLPGDSRDERRQTSFESGTHTGAESRFVSCYRTDGGLVCSHWRFIGRRCLPQLAEVGGYLNFVVRHRRRSGRWK